MAVRPVHVYRGHPPPDAHDSSTRRSCRAGAPSSAANDPALRGSQMREHPLMAKSMHETQRLSFDGAVDADGHILEPPDLWETYLEPKYRDRALRIVPDENGLEELEIGGEPAQPRRQGPLGVPGGPGGPPPRAGLQD